MLIMIDLPAVASGAPEGGLKPFYSKRFNMGPDGVPLVKIGTYTGLSRVTISSKGGLEVKSGNGPGLTVAGFSNVSVRLDKTQPAKVRYWVSVKSVPVSDRKAYLRGLALMKRWRLKTTTKEQGFLIALKGKVLDTRRILFSVGPFSSYLKAKKRMYRLAKRRHGVFVHSEMIRLPSGALKATSGNVTLSGAGAFTFIGVHGNPIKVTVGNTTREYPGIIHTVIDRRGKLAVVNELSMETYLAGILPSELFPSAPMEALKAQAIAARGQVLAKMGTRHHGDPFHLCAQVHCQVYDGLHKVYKRTTLAVNKTKGEVLFDRKGLPADTVYHSSSGGHGENNENVWGGEPKPYLRGRPDGVKWHYTSEKGLAKFLANPGPAYCKKGNPGFRWTVTIGPKKMRKLLRKRHMAGTLRTITVKKRGVSGRALEALIRTSRRKRLLKGELTIRRFFGGLRSSMFLVNKRGNKFVFTGGGFGHGVGMSQWGAINRAKSGQVYRTILNHYYKGTLLKKLY